MSLTKPKRILPQDLVQNTQISNQQIYETGHQIKKTKKQITTTVDLMEDMLEQQTEKEREAVVIAMQNLEKKVNAIKEQKTYKSLESELKSLENKFNVEMETIFKHYSKAIKRIYNAYPNEKERQLKLHQFHQVIGDAFLTKDEKKILTLMNQQVKQIPHSVVKLPLLN